MNVLIFLFKLLAALISVYNLLCFIRIILTWIPNLSYSKFSQILAKICDPYLHLFRGIKWLVWGSFDFSPAVALCILGAVSTLLSNFANAGRIRLGFFLSMLLTLSWSIISSIFLFLTLLLVIRLVLLLINKSSIESHPFVTTVDRSLSSLIFRISGTFYGNKPVSFKKALIISSITLIAVQICGGILINILSELLAKIPF